jgi:hypothetical protein
VRAFHVSDLGSVLADRIVVAVLGATLLMLVIGMLRPRSLRERYRPNSATKNVRYCRNECTRSCEIASEARLVGRRHFPHGASEQRTSFAHFGGMATRKAWRYSDIEAVAYTRGEVTLHIRVVGARNSNGESVL